MKDKSVNLEDIGVKLRDTYSDGYEFEYAEGFIPSKELKQELKDKHGMIVRSEILNVHTDKWMRFK